MFPVTDEENTQNLAVTYSFEIKVTFSDIAFRNVIESFLIFNILIIAVIVVNSKLV